MNITDYYPSLPSCGLCKHTIGPSDRFTIDHYKCSADLHQSFRDDIEKLTKQRDLLRAALMRLVGASETSELEQLEVVMRMMPAPAEDIAVSIDAIHALIATAEKP